MSVVPAERLNAHSAPADVRAACRAELWSRPTSGLAAGCVQANLVIVPDRYAHDFQSFCERNPKPCPLLEVTRPGDPTPRCMAPSADLRSDLPRYRIWRNGELADEPTHIRDDWQDDFVAFLIGCSFTFEAALQRAHLPVRHVEEGRNVPMYRTNVPCESAGPFHGPLVVSMRPMTPVQAAEAARVTARFPSVHGAPIHVADPAQLGIRDLSRPDFGDPVTIHAGEVPVFWACGVTPQCALMQARIPLAITHAPGCMLVTDMQDAELERHASD